MVVDLFYVAIYWADIAASVVAGLALLVIGIMVVAGKVKSTRIFGVSFIFSGIALAVTFVFNFLLRYINQEMLVRMSYVTSITSLVSKFAVALCICIFFHKNYGKKYIYIPIMLITVAAPVANLIVTRGLLNSGMGLVSSYWVMLVQVVNEFVVGAAISVITISVFYKFRNVEKIIPKAWIAYTIKFIAGVFFSGFSIITYSMMVATNGMRQAEMTGFAGFWMANYETLNIYVDILSALAALVVPLYIVVMVYKNKALAGVESGVSVAVEGGAESGVEAAIEADAESGVTDAEAE